jgi:formyltetrahydrofolate-dependent phosphoribosylglycinamide formyltransferase
MLTRIAVLISGNGSNLQAIIDAVRMKVLPAEIVVVVSNRKGAYGLARAAKAGIATCYHPLKTYSDTGRSRAEYDADLASLVQAYDPDWVVLAGWMHILSDAFLQHFPYRVVNLHPALPGQFPGSHAIAEAFAAYQQGAIKHTGCMVHLVPDEAVDAGPIIGTVDVPIYPTDSEETLANRMHQAEHTLLIQSLLRLMEGDEEIDDEADDEIDEDLDEELDDE